MCAKFPALESLLHYHAVHAVHYVLQRNNKNSLIFAQSRQQLRLRMTYFLRKCLQLIDEKLFDSRLLYIPIFGDAMSFSGFELAYASDLGRHGS